MHKLTVKPLPRKQAITQGNGSAALHCKRFFLGELIGEQAQVAWSSKGPQALYGTIVDETHSTFIFATQNGEKVVPKKGSVFFFPAAGCSINGALLAGRPEERTKKLSKKLK